MIHLIFIWLFKRNTLHFNAFEVSLSLERVAEQIYFKDKTAMCKIASINMDKINGSQKRLSTSF